MKLTTEELYMLRAVMVCGMLPIIALWMLVERAEYRMRKRDIYNWERSNPDTHFLHPDDLRAQRGIILIVVMRLTGIAAVVAILVALFA